MALQACGGGGGGSTSPTTTLPGGSGTTTPPATTPAPTPTPTPIPITSPTPSPGPIGSTTEDATSSQLSPIHAFSAWERGTFGQTITVAVFDSGVASGLSEFTGRITTGYNVQSGMQGGDTADLDDHGTFVASVLAAARDGNGMEGVAPLAVIAPVKLGNPDSDGNYNGFTYTELAAAIDWARGRNIRITNNSYTNPSTIAALGQANVLSDYAAPIAAWQRFITAGGVVVFSAGNDSASDPDVEGALPSIASGLQKGWLTTVAIGSDGKIASYSNRCGIAAAWCLAAPGTAVATAPDGTLYNVTGTSFPAPLASGSIALLLAEFPGLTAQKALTILLQTANRTGVYADSATYGQGLIDLDAASAPQGTESVASAAGATTALAATTLQLGPAFGTGLKTALADTPLLFRDSFNRGYFSSLARVVGSTAISYDPAAHLAGFGREPSQTIDAGPVHMSIVATGGQDDQIDIRYATDRVGFAATWGGEAARPMALSEAADRDLLTPSSVSDPYLALVEAAGAFAVDLPAFGGRAAFGAAFGHSAYDLLERADPVRNDRASHFSEVAVTASWQVGIGRDVTLKAESGALFDSHGLLGSEGNGVGAMTDATTYHAGLIGAVSLGAKTLLSAGFHAGWSEAGTTQAALLAGVRDVVSLAGGAALGIADAATAGDRLTIGVGLPLRSVSGTADLLIPGDIAADGSTVWRRLAAPLKADGSEVDVQASWLAPLDGKTDIALAALVRENPDNVRTAPAEGVVGVRLDRWF